MDVVERTASARGDDASSPPPSSSFAPAADDPSAGDARGPSDRGREVGKLIIREAAPTLPSVTAAASSSATTVRVRTGVESDAARHRAPDVSLYETSRYRREAPVRPERTVFQFPFATLAPEREEVEVGRLDVRAPVPNVFEAPNHEVGKLTINEARKEEAPLPSGTSAVPQFEPLTDDPRKESFNDWGGTVESGHEWYGSKIDDPSKMSGEQPRTKTPGEVGRVNGHEAEKFDQIFVGEVSNNIRLDPPPDDPPKNPCKEWETNVESTTKTEQQGERYGGNIVDSSQMPIKESQTITYEVGREGAPLRSETFSGLPHFNLGSANPPKEPLDRWGTNVELEPAPSKAKEQQGDGKAEGEISSEIPSKESKTETGWVNFHETDEFEKMKTLIGEVSNNDRRDPEGANFKDPPVNPFEEWGANLELTGKTEQQGERYGGNIIDSSLMPSEESRTKTHGEVGSVNFHEGDESKEIFIGEVSNDNRRDPEGANFKDPPEYPLEEWGANFKSTRKTELHGECYGGIAGDSSKMPNEEFRTNTHGEAGRVNFHDADEFEEIFVGEVSNNNRPDPDDSQDPEGAYGGDSFDDDDQYDDATGGALLVASDGSTSTSSYNGSKDFDAYARIEPPADDNERKKRLCFYLLVLLLLLVIIALLGALLGQKNGDERVAAAAGSVGGVLLPPVAVANATNATAAPSSYPSESSSATPSPAPSTECPMGTKAFSIEHLPHFGRDDPLSTTTTNGGAAWKIKNACTDEVVARCLPCSAGGVALLSQQRGWTLAEVRSSNAAPDVDGHALRRRLQEEEPVGRTTACFPADGEFALEILPAEDATEACCGFDPAASVVSYDGVVIGYGPYGGTFGGDRSNGIAYFGESESPCASAPPSVAGSMWPSPSPSRTPSDVPSTGPPTQSPLPFLGECPESYVPFGANSYPMGIKVESNGIVYECVGPSCGSYGLDLGSALAMTRSGSPRGQTWEVVGLCEGTLGPTERPTAPPTSSPTRLPSTSPSQSPSEMPTSEPTSAPSTIPSDPPSNPPTSGPTPPPTTRMRTRTPTGRPSAKPTCSTEQDFNLCLAVDMSGSVCNDGTGSECLECRAAFLPIFFKSPCQDRFVSEDTCCDNFASVKEFSSLMVDLLDDFPAEKSFSVVQFATDARLASGLKSAARTLPAIDRLDYTGGLTNHAAAIRTCQDTLPTRDGRRNFIMLITDGVSSEPGYDPEGAAVAAATSAEGGGTFVVPVFISPRNDWSALSFMRRLSSDGRVFDVTDFGSLGKLQDSLVNQVSCS